MRLQASSCEHIKVAWIYYKMVLITNDDKLIDGKDVNNPTRLQEESTKSTTQ